MARHRSRGCRRHLVAARLRTRAVEPDTVPEPKRTKAGRYLMAAEVPAFIQAQGGAGKVLFLDLRTRAEAM